MKNQVKCRSMTMRAVIEITDSNKSLYGGHFIQNIMENTQYPQIEQGKTSLS